MSRSLIETVIGALVLLVAGVFVALAYSATNLSASSGYEIQAHFQSSVGIGPGTDVRVSGIKVGTVTGQTLDPERYQAIVTMSIDESVKLPEDTIAKIANEGLLGGSYMSLEPGGAPDMLAPGGVIEFTQSPVDLISLLGKFIFSAGEAASQDKPAQ